MSEHHNQGRQGQGFRRRRPRNNNYKSRHRMPQNESRKESKKPSLLQRVLSFFGLGKKAEVTSRRSKHQGQSSKNHTRPIKNDRAAKARKPSKPTGERKRMNSTLPTRNSRLYVGNLSYEATESELEELFKGFGQVRSVEIIYTPRTYRSKGYAFVEMRHMDDARRAAEVLHEQPFMGRELMVSAATEKPPTEESAAPADSTAAAEATATAQENQA